MDFPTLLDVDQLTMSYTADVPALEAVSFELHQGTLHAILGEDGAGKTTLMKILGGAIPTDKTTGQILLGGQPLVLRTLADGIHRGIAMVPRKIAVFDHMSVSDNLMVASWQQDRRFVTSRRATESRASDLLARWGIDLDLSASVRAMSPLQQREMMILRALAAAPQVLILDEPLAGITGQHAASQLLLAVRRLVDRGATCLYLARRPAEAMQIAQTITVLRDGAVNGTWERIQFDEATLSVAMASQRLGDSQVIRPDDDFAERGGLFGPLSEAFDRWFRPRS